MRKLGIAIGVVAVIIVAGGLILPHAIDVNSYHDKIQSELGKKLDFLLQEMHREANTMLSKTPGVESEALAITGLALEIKAEIEKLREQVQNIE